jgi:hypothetical protein
MCKSTNPEMEKPIRRAVHVGDGRHVDVEEGRLREPERPSTYDPPTCEASGSWKALFAIPYYRQWYARRKQQTSLLTMRHRRFPNRPKHLTIEEYIPLRNAALEQAEKDMAALGKAGIDFGEIGNEALRITLQIMRLPGERSLRLKAARQVLEWTLPKPSRQAVSALSSAEEWLDTVAKKA